MPNLTGLAALFRLRPDRAADYLAAKGYKLSGPYWEMDGPQHSHLFTVANLAKLDVLTDIRSAVQKALDEGQTEKWFDKQLVDVLKAKGWWGGKDGSLRRLQTIYRTNLQTAYMAGRHQQAMEQKDRRPWAQYLAVRDQRSRPAHAALHGQVFRIDSPAWACVAPPSGYNCRCRARYLSDEDLKKRNLKPATDIQILEREPPGNKPVNPATGESPERWIQRGVSVPSKTNPGERDILWADPGWDNIPGSDGAERALVDRLMAKATDLGDGVRMAVQAGLQEVAEKVAVTAPVADLTAWHQAPPRDLDEVLKRGQAREEALFGASAKNMDALADKLARLKADLDKKTGGLYTPEADWMAETDPKAYANLIRSHGAAIEALQKARRSGENVMEKTLKGMRSKVTDGHKELSDLGITMTSPTAAAAKVSIKYIDKINKVIRENLVAFYKQFGIGTERVSAIFDDLDEARAYCLAWGDANGDLINMGVSWNSKRVLWHEMGHSVEFLGETNDVARAWLARRATGSPLKLNDLLKSDKYKDNEIAFPNHFFHPYVGKDYGDGFTEVMSMGLQNFIDAETLLEFWLTDREHFRLILGLLKL